MKANIIKKFDQMESGRMRLFQLIQNQNDETLNKKPDPEKWSPVQILHHLMDAESGTLNYIRKKIANPDQLEQSGIREKMNAFLLSVFLRAPLKWKAPKVVSTVPEHDTLTNTLRRYNEVRENWKQLIDSMPEDQMKKKIFRHPVAGRMNLYDTLNFIDLHARRHFRQIRQILNT